MGAHVPLRLADTPIAFDQRGFAMSTTAPDNRCQECKCPACPHDNGGLDFCAQCRFNDCTADRAYCGQGDDT